MPNIRKSAAPLLIVLALLLASAGFAQATTTYFTVQSGKTTTVPIKLAVEDRVLIQYKLVGGHVNNLHVSMAFPNATVKDLGASGDFTYRFTCDAEGEYTLNFTNTDPTENIQITLNYEIDHYILGIPQMLFMVILIAVISLVGVAVFIGLSRKP
jgi:hypothetical protein